MKTKPVAPVLSTPANDLLDEDFRERPDENWTAAAMELPDHLWDESLLGPIRDFLARPGKRFRGSLVDSSWSLAGGQGPTPTVLPMAVELLHAGSLIIDDVQDESHTRRGGATVHESYGIPKAINCGNWLYFWPLTLISRGGFEPQVELALLRATHLALLRCHQGQALDLSVRVDKLPQHQVARAVATTTELKTASLVELSASLGAIAAGASMPVQRELREFAHVLGVSLQKLDDYGSILCSSRQSKGLEDIALARPTWVWAELATHAPEVTFVALQNKQAKIATERSNPRPLLEEIEQVLGQAPIKRVSAELDAAYQKLERALPDNSALQDLLSEVEKLRGAYV